MSVCVLVFANIFLRLDSEKSVKTPSKDQTHYWHDGLVGFYDIQSL